MDKRYRVVPPAGVEIVDSVGGRIYAEVPADRPDHPACYEGEWVCPHGPCPVRAVCVRVKALFHKHLPRLRCPLCLRRLDFRHWLSVVALEEVPAPDGAKKPRSGTRRRKAPKASRTAVRT